MSKTPQLYPDLIKIKLVRFRVVIDAVVIHKNKSQYAIAYSNPNNGTKYIEHITEKNLTKDIELAEIYESGLYQAMSEKDN